MIEPNPVDYLNDPLNEITRKERRNLLIASTVGLLVAKAGMVPTKFEAFGIELSVPDQEVFVILMLLIVLYFLAAFVIYGISDFLVWRKKYQDYLEQVAGSDANWSPKDQYNYDELHSTVPGIAWLYAWSKPAAFARSIFEFSVPVIFALVAGMFLIKHLIFS
ncbi:hypothetical protein A1359_02260 [Methylomonas lenta]|uniref:Uncharacterized protein n=1 Tax=Methylomonas lenta TaxID=980561 RepID=A0A177MUS7_9GAMM|nr:hypothetical protein [Methylomonas lenta]OAI09362.1 hypothetical protein A1359_02260 [Methylomonas lenta]